MNPTKITSRLAHRSFGDLINRIVYKNESFIVQRNGKDVAILAPLPENNKTPEKPKKQKRAA